MLEGVIKGLLDGAIQVAKELLGDRIKKKNEELLKRKRELTQAKIFRPAQLAMISLDATERLEGSIKVSAEETFIHIRKHFERVRTWANEVSFIDLKGSRALESVYIELDTWVVPLKVQMETCERDSRVHLLEKVLVDNRHGVVLGQPGAGKTTSMKKLCRIVQDFGPAALRYSGPIVIRLREILDSGCGNDIFRAVAEIISFECVIYNAPAKSVDGLAYPSFLHVLDALSVVLILDGFDELRSHELKISVLAEFRRMCESLRRTKVILTCRSGDFNFDIENCDTFEIAPLTKAQIEGFSRKWIPDSEKAQQFIHAVENSPFFDTAIRPLVLAHLCALYERLGRIPEKPKTVYRKVFLLLLEQWDEQRSINRPSRYGDFQADQKAEFLAHFAYFLTTAVGGTVFDRASAINAYRSICDNFGLERREAENVLDEIEGHNGLFINAGFNRYEFAHKSLQEFLAAEHLVRLPSIPDSVSILELLPNELAIATSISSRPSEYFSVLFLTVLSLNNLRASFFDQFANRLIIERPDFRKFDNLIVAFGVLFRLWLGHSCHDLGNGLIRSVDVRAVDSMVQLIKGIEQSLEVHALRAFFEEANVPQFTIGQNRFSTIKMRKDYRWKGAPDYLNVPAFLME